MVDQREEFSTSEFRRYAAECRRLAAAARPQPKPVARKPRAADRFGAIINQFRQPRRRSRKLAASKLAATWAQR
jgi:hypothetical protein